MQLFSANATIFSNAHKKLKKPPSKVAHNRPKPFLTQPSPSHSQQPKIDFSYYEISGPDICSLICVHITAAWVCCLQLYLKSSQIAAWWAFTNYVQGRNHGENLVAISAMVGTQRKKSNIFFSSLIWTPPGTPGLTKDVHWSWIWRFGALILSQNWMNLKRNLPWFQTIQHCKMVKNDTG